ncbi:MAG: zinc ABC transporter substrate-binding protein [Chloroflexi bacterium]|nr:zinc ABC transporter substrate-binding protein [Chloroflexota bacterium]
MKRVLLFFILIATSLLSVLSCVPHNNDSDRINIAVSIAPYGDLVRQIGKDKVSVRVLVPPGRTPHDYEPPPSAMTRIATAQAYLAVGSGIDVERQYLDKILAQNNHLAFYDLSVGIELLDGHGHEENRSHEHEGGDPHVWTSVENSIIIAYNIYLALCQLAPQYSDYFAQNLQNYTQRANKLINDINNLFVDMQRNIFFTYHGSMSYFADEFGLEQISIKAEGKEITPASLANKIDQAKKSSVKMIYVENEYSDSVAKVVAEELKGQVLHINALSDNYLAAMWQNALNLWEGLK